MAHFRQLDCTAPFQVDVYTDKLDDLGATGGTNKAQSRGKFVTSTRFEPAIFPSCDHWAQLLDKALGCYRTS